MERGEELPELLRRHELRGAAGGAAAAAEELLERLGRELGEERGEVVERLGGEVLEHLLEREQVAERELGGVLGGRRAAAAGLRELLGDRRERFGRDLREDLREALHHLGRELLAGAAGARAGRAGGEAGEGLGREVLEHLSELGAGGGVEGREEVVEVELLAEREAVERAGVGELALAEGVGERGEGFGRELGEEGEKLGEE